MTPDEIQQFIDTAPYPVVVDLIERSHTTYAAWTMAAASEGHTMTEARMMGFIAMAAAQEMDVVLRRWRVG